MSILNNFEKSIEKVKHDLDGIIDKKIPIGNTKKESFIFSKRKENYYASSFGKKINDLIESGWKLSPS